MADREQDHDEEPHAAERAADWLMRLEAGQACDKQALVRWLKRSPEAVSEMLLAKSTDIVLRQLFRERSAMQRFPSSTSNVIPFPGRESRVLKRPGRRNRWAFMGSSMAGVAAVATALIVQPLFLRDLLQPNVYTTSVGEQRAVELADGSAIVINAESSVRVNFSERTRDIYLSSGQAMFTVAKDPKRPFRVHVRSATSDGSARSETIIQAVGTKFDVRRRPDRVNVAVVEGTVRISAEPATDQRSTRRLPQLVELTRVSAGEGVSIADTGQITVPAPINVADVGAWQQRRLVFSDSTLAEIAEEFSHYNRLPHVVIEGSELRARRLSGAFDADSPETLLLYLEGDNTLEINRRGDEIVIRQRPEMPQSGLSED